MCIRDSNKGVGVQVLVLTPTRELALQVTEATATYGRKLADLRTATVVGGMPYGAQLKALSRRVDVLVATPGRLIDHLQAGRVKLNTVHTLVLDEDVYKRQYMITKRLKRQNLFAKPHVIQRCLKQRRIQTTVKLRPKIDNSICVHSYQFFCSSTIIAT